MFLVHCLQFCLFPPSFCAGYRRMVHILQRNGDESSLFFKCLAAADPMMAAKPKERVSDVVHSSSVPEGHDEREQEHVEAATICKHQAVTLPDCRIKTAKLLLDQKKKLSGVEAQWRFTENHQHSVFIVLPVVAARLPPPPHTHSPAEHSSCRPSPANLLSSPSLSDPCSHSHVPKLILGIRDEMRHPEERIARRWRRNTSSPETHNNHQEIWQLLRRTTSFGCQNHRFD